MASSTITFRESHTLFSVSPEDLDAVCASEGFQVIREHLESSVSQSLCSEHSPCDEDTREEWLLHRDILHALVVPIIQLVNRANSLARATLCSNTPEDLELAFRGDARDAFLMLQCFVEDERDWCQSEGCPGCVTSATLSTETHIRLTMASILFTERTPTPPTPSSLTLPSFLFFLPSIEAAVSTDPFWGPSYYPYIYSRAENLCGSLQALMQQCQELEVLVTSPAVSPGLCRSPNISPCSPGLIVEEQKGGPIKLSKSKMARRQAKLQREEQAILKRIAYQCWGIVAMPQNARKQLATDRPSYFVRRRSLTCP